MSAIAEPLTAGVGICLDAAALNRLLEPDCAAAVWRRKMPADVKSWLAELDPETLPRGRVVLPAHSVGAMVENLLEIAGTPDGPERDWLAADIV